MTADLYIRVDAGGRYQPFRLVNGLYKLDVGPPFATPREAIDFCNRAAANAAGQDAPDALGVDADSTPRSRSRVGGRPGASYAVDRPASRSAAHLTRAPFGAAHGEPDGRPSEGPDVDQVSPLGPVAGLPPSAAGNSQLADTPPPALGL
jgi:hypothetical protein